MVFLQALHSAMSVPCSGNALHGVVGTGEGRDVRHLVLDGGLADGAFVLDGVALCPRRVDDEVHLLVQDNIQNVGAAFGDLVHHFALDASLFVELGGAFGCVDLEAQFLELLADFDSLFRQVNLIGQANQHGTFVREEGTCGFLALVVSEGEVFGEAQHFTGGTHFRAENRVNLGELVKREHSFLGAVVLELLVLELEVFKLFAEHEVRSEAGTYRPFRLRSTLVSDDSLRRVAYGSQACYKPWRPAARYRTLSFWAFPHIHVRSGYILWVARFTPFPPNLIKRHHSAAPRGHYP